MYKLIIADDVELIRTMLARCIKEYQTHIDVTGVFSDGDAVMDYISCHDVDIIITDIRMPGKTGLDIAKYVNDNLTDTKVIIISAFDDFEYAKKAIKYGVFDYLKKPIDVPELMETIERIIILLENQDEEKNNHLEMIDIDKLCFWEEIVLQNGQMDCSMLKTLYPYISLDDLVINTYMLHMMNYKTFRATKWNYESEKLVEAIHGLIKLAIKDMNATEVECIDLSNDRMQIIVLGNRETKIDYQKISDNLFSLIDLKTEYSNMITVNDITTFNKDVFIGNIHEMSYEQMHEKSPIEECIDSAKKYIHDNIEAYISREEIAHFVGYSDSYFAKCFKEATGLSVNKYIQNERIKRIIELLSTDMKIKSIAEKMGYRDVRVLRNTFKAYMGMTPDEYRRKMQKHNWSSEE